jgi:hypothetical protein
MWENVFIGVTQFATKKQVKYLTHMLCIWIPCYKLYEEGMLFYVLTLNYMCHFKISSINLIIKVKHKIKNVYFHGCSLVHIVFYFPTYLST